MRVNRDPKGPLVLIRSLSDLRGWGGSACGVVWLSTSVVPEQVEAEGVSDFGPDPAAIEGWLWLKRWANGDVGDCTVKQALEHGGISLWWLADQWMIYGHGLVSFDEIFRGIHRIARAARRHSPSGIVLLSHNAGDDLIACAVAAHFNVPYTWRVSCAERAWRRWIAFLRPRILARARLLKMIVLGWFARRIVPARDVQNEREPLLFNTTHMSLRAPKWEDRLVQPLIERATAEGHRPVALHLDFRRSLGLATLFRRPAHIMPWERFLRLSHVREALRTRRRIRTRWRSTPGELCGIPVGDLLKDRIRLLLYYRTFDAIIALGMARAAVAALRPQCLFVTDEYDMWGRALVVASRQAGVRVVAIQHGIIDENHSGYHNLADDIAPDGRSDAVYCPLPDVTGVHGRIPAAALRDFGRYPESSVHITGSLPIERALSRSRDRVALRRSLKLPLNGTMFVFFGAPGQIFPCDQANLEAVCAAGTALPETTFILRPHPLDADGPKRYAAAAKQVKLVAPVMAEADPYDLILASDAVLTANSTTALDGMALSRPVVHINLTTSEDQFPFVSRGGAIDVRRSADLPAALRRLENPHYRAIVVNRHHEYIDLVFTRRNGAAARLLALAAGTPVRMSAGA